MHAYTLIIVYILLCICFFPPSYGYISNIKRIQFWKAITLVSLCSSLKRHLLPKESQQIIASFCQSPMTPFRKKWTWEIKNNVTLWEKRTTEMPNPVVWQDISREARIRTTQITESNSRNWRPFKCGKGRCKGSVFLFFSRICGKGGELSDSVYLQKMPSWSGKEQICQSHCIGGESEDFALHRWRLLWQGPPICALVRHCPGLDLAKKKKKKSLQCLQLSEPCNFWNTVSLGKSMAAWHSKQTHTCILSVHTVSELLKGVQRRHTLHLFLHSSTILGFFLRMWLLGRERSSFIIQLPKRGKTLRV